jgi:cell division protein FtsB
LSNLVGEMLVGRVGFGESFQACSASNSAIDAMAVSIVRLYQEGDELRAEVAMLREQARILADERDEARVQYRSTEALAMALVKTIDELKTEKAELVVKLVNLEGRSRRATLDEIAESVRDKYDPRHEGEEDE